MITGWQEIDPNGVGMTVSQVLKVLNDKDNQDCYENLRSALWELAPPRDGKALNPRSIGMKLHHLRRRVVDGKLLDRRDNASGAIWTVTDGTTGTKGSKGTKSGHLAAHTRTRRHTRSTSGPTRNSPFSGVSPSTCPHADVAETRTHDGFINRDCRDCGARLTCIKERPNDPQRP